MTPAVVTLRRNDKLVVAEDVMRLGRIRHIPILNDDGGLAGIVSQRDLFHRGLVKAMGYGLAGRLTFDMVVIEEAMQTDVVTTTPETSLRDAARLMLSRGVGCLVVLEGGRLAGILTENDFVKAQAGD